METNSKRSVGRTSISDLPDDVLVHILSFLPTNQAVRTTALLKQWQGLWVHAPALDFEIFLNRCDHLIELLPIKKALALHRSPKVTRFRFSSAHYGDVSEDLAWGLDSLIRSAVERHVEDLTLELDPDPDSWLRYYALPRQVYSCGSLRQLKTKFCELLPNGRLNWNSLRVLDVDHGRWNEGVLTSLLAGSPALESLRLRRFTGIRRVDVAAPSNLKELVLDSCLDLFGNECWNFGIYAPCIKELKLSGFWKSHCPELIDVGSVVKADLDFHMKAWDLTWNVDIVKKLIETVRRSTQLTIGPWFSQILTLMVARPDSHCASISRLESLVMMDIEFYHDHHLIGLYNLLQHTQTLERLVVRFGGEYDYGVDNLCDYDAALRGGPPCRLLSNLKAVELFGVGARVCLWFGFANFLLNDLVSLEKMDIYPHRWVRTHSMIKLSKALLRLPRCSPHAVVTFH